MLNSKNSNYLIAQKLIYKIKIAFDFNCETDTKFKTWPCGPRRFWADICVRRTRKRTRVQPNQSWIRTPPVHARVERVSILKIIVHA